MKTLEFSSWPLLIVRNARALTSAALAFSLAAPALADVVVYPGNPLQDIFLNNQSVPGGVLTSPGTQITDYITCYNSCFKNNSITGNSVTLNSSENNIAVFGAANGRDADPVNNNQVFINGGMVSSVRGGYSIPYWSSNLDYAIANNNSVVINNMSRDRSYSSSAFYSGIYGGYAFETKATASGNTVDIRGGDLADTIISGGYAQGLNWNGLSTASNNTVRISGAPNLSGASVYGGVAMCYCPSSISTGNTLQVVDTAGLRMSYLGYFQKMEFQLPATLTPGVSILTASAGIYLGTDFVVQVSAPADLPLHPGDQFILIDAYVGTDSDISGNVVAASQSGMLNGYAYTIEKLSDGTRAVLVLKIGAAVGPSPHDGIYRITNADGSPGDYLSVHSNGSTLIATIYRSADPANAASFALTDGGASVATLYKWGSWDLYSGTLSSNSATLTGYSQYGLCKANVSLTFSGAGGTIRVAPNGPSEFAPAGAQPACSAAATALTLQPLASALPGAANDGIYLITNADGSPGAYVSVHSNAAGVIATMYASSDPASGAFQITDGGASVATLYKWGSWDLYSGAQSGSTVTLTGYAQYGLCKATGTMTFSGAASGTIRIAPNGPSEFAPTGAQPACSASAVTLTMQRIF